MTPEQTRASIAAWLDAEADKRKRGAVRRMLRVAADAVRAGLDLEEG